jgi:hypothetical protein
LKATLEGARDRFDSHSKARNSDLKEVSKAASKAASKDASKTASKEERRRSKDGVE